MLLHPVIPGILRSKVSIFVDLHRKTRLITEQAQWQQQRASQLQKLASASVAINGALDGADAADHHRIAPGDVIGTQQAITLFFLEDDSNGPVKTRAFSSFSDKYEQWRGPAHEPGCGGDFGNRQKLQTHARLPGGVSRTFGFSAAQATRKRAEIPPIPRASGGASPSSAARRGRTMGMIYVSDKTAGIFTADDEAILVQLTQMAAVARVENITSFEAREANRAKDQFIAVLSHELRTPLTPVLATIASMQADRRNGPEVQDDLKVLRRNVELEARLIDDLLDLTRISKGKIELNLEVVDGNESLREAANICQNDVTEKQIELVLDLAAKERFVKGDATPKACSRYSGIFLKKCGEVHRQGRADCG